MAAGIRKAIAGGDPNHADAFHAANQKATGKIPSRINDIVDQRRVLPNPRFGQDMLAGNG
jgi:hypothetical protein